MGVTNRSIRHHSGLNCDIISAKETFVPVGTLELPLQMIDAAKGFAARENVTVCDLFAQLLHSRYGVEFGFAYAVPEQHQKRKRVRVPESVNRSRASFNCRLIRKDA